MVCRPRQYRHYANLHPRHRQTPQRYSQKISLTGVILEQIKAALVVNMILSYDNIILTFHYNSMSTISVPLTPKLIHHLDELVEKTGASRAGVMRKALERFAEEEAINAVLLAERDVREGKILRGDLHEILMKID